MKYAVLVAGGTGGHINAALAVGEALKDQGYEILYLTGKRPLDYKLFKGQNVRHLNSKPLRTNNPFILIKNIILNFIGFVSIFFLYVTKRPKFIVGAGGYVCGPTLLAGFLQGVPVFIIEQNAVMGLTNKILGWISDRIFVHFTKTKGLYSVLAKKVRVVGNPTRKSIQPVPNKKIDTNLKVLVFGGSLGATQINKVIFDIELGNFKRDFYWSQVGGRWYHFSQPRGLEVSDSKDSLKWARALKSLALTEEKSEIGAKIDNLIWP